MLVGPGVGKKTYPKERGRKHNLSTRKARGWGGFGAASDACELWCWRRLLRVPWTARRSHQSILREISPGCSLEGLMLKLKLPILMRRADSLDMGLGGPQEFVMDREAWHAAIHGVAESGTS